MQAQNAARESWIVGYCFTINSVIGAGIMALPSAYHISGWGLGLLSQFLAIFYSIASSYQLMSAWSRAEAITQLKQDGIEVHPIKFWNAFIHPKSEESEKLIKHDIIPKIAHRKIDLYDILKLTLGETQSTILIAVYVISIYPWLTAYLSVFSTSLASNLPLFGQACNIYEEPDFYNPCRVIYWLYLSVFAIFIIVLSCFHMHEHKHLQITMTFVRLFGIILMISTSIYAIVTGTGLEGPVGTESSPRLADPLHFDRVFFTVIFASLFQNILPTCTSFVENKSEMMPKIIKATIATFTVLYALIGMIPAFAISNPLPMVSLNWRNYSAGEMLEDRAWWTYFVAYLIVLLPALDIMSSFPLIAINFSDNLMCIAYGVEDEDQVSHKAMIGFRMIVVVPSLILAIFFYDVGPIVEFCGVMSIYVVGVAIPLACLAAQQIIHEKNEFDFRYNYEIAIASIIASTLVLIAALASKIFAYI